MKRLCLAVLLAFPVLGHAYLLVPGDPTAQRTPHPALSSQTPLNLPLAEAMWSATPVYETGLIAVPNAYVLMKPKEPSGGMFDARYNSANRELLGQFTLYDIYQGFDILASAFQNNAQALSQSGQNLPPLPATAFQRYGVDLHLGYLNPEFHSLYSSANMHYRNARQMSYEDKYWMSNLQFFWKSSEDTQMMLKGIYNQRHSLGKIYVRKDGQRFISDNPTPGSYSSQQIQRIKIDHYGLFYGMDHHSDRAHVYLMTQARYDSSDAIETADLYDPGQFPKTRVEQNVTQALAWVDTTYQLSRSWVVGAGLKADYYQLDRYKNIFVPASQETLTITANTLVRNARLMPNLGLYFVPAQDWTVSLSYDQTRRIPSEEERFVPGPFPTSAASVAIGQINADLRPEESKNLSFGLDYQHQQDEKQLKVLWNSQFSWVTDYIAQVRQGNTFRFSNIPNVRLSRHTLDIQYSGARWLLGLNAAYRWGNELYTDSRGFEHHKVLTPLDAPSIALRGQFEVLPKLFTLGIKVEHHLKARMPQGETANKGYTLTSLFADLRIHKGFLDGLTIQAKVENLFNVIYRPAFYEYNGGGTSVQLDLTYHF